MNIKDKVNNTIKEAMKAKDTEKLTAYRSIKSAFMILETSGSEVKEDDYLKAIIKMAKQRKDSIAIYDEQGRDDLSSIEKSELAFIEELLPKSLSEDEIRAAVTNIIADTGAEGMKDMGKVMGIASKQLGAGADGKVLSGIVRSILA